MEAARKEWDHMDDSAKEKYQKMEEASLSEAKTSQEARGRKKKVKEEVKIDPSTVTCDKPLDDMKPSELRGLA